MLEREELGRTGLSPAAASQAVAAVLRTLTRGCRCCRCHRCLSRAGGKRGEGGAELLKWVRQWGSSRLVSSHRSWPPTDAPRQQRPRLQPVAQGLITWRHRQRGKKSLLPSFGIRSQPGAGSDESPAGVRRETSRVAGCESIRTSLVVPLGAVGLDFGVGWRFIPGLLLAGRSLRSLIYFPRGK